MLKSESDQNETLWKMSMEKITENHHKEITQNVEGHICNPTTQIKAEKARAQRFGLY